MASSCREAGEFKLHFDRHQSPVQLLALVNLPDEEISVPSVDFRVCDVDHVFVDVEVHLKHKSMIEMRMKFNSKIVLASLNYAIRFSTTCVRTTLEITSDSDWNSPWSAEVPLVHTTFIILCLKHSRLLSNSSTVVFM